MFQAKNGKKFGSIFAGRKYDENHSEDGVHSEGGKPSPEHEAAETPEFEAGEQEGAVEHEAEQHEGEEHPVVAEHGPAHKVSISHEEGRHTVVSQHGDGHTHKVVHKTKQEAHKEAQRLAAAEEDEQKPAEKTPAENESDGFQMPGLE